MSKEELQAENRRLFSELRKMHNDYTPIEVIIQELDREYERSKGNFPLMRYNKLKRMIKDSTTDEALAKARVYVEKAKRPTSEHTPKSGVGKLLATCKGFATSSPEDSPTSGTDPPPKSSKFGGFLEKCKSFTKKDSSGMTKQELVADNEEKRREIEQYYSKFLRAYNRLDKLKRDYEQSKGENFIARHGRLKSMIKDVTYDKNLKT